MAKKALLGTIALAMLLASTGAGRANDFAGDSIVPLLEGVSSGTGLLPVKAVEEKSGAAAAKHAALVPFEQSASAFRLAGEDDVGTFTFHLDGAQASAGGALQLSYRNAVSVLPDTATMDVEINGRQAGSFAIASPSGFRAEALRIEAEFLKPGRNVVQLRARQYHRVDCTLEATYELWTELDPASSGFATSRPTRFTDFDSLLAIGRDARQRTDIRLVIPGTPGQEALNEAAPVVQALALFLGRDDIAITVGDRPGAGPGIDLVMAMDRDGAAALLKLGLDHAPRGLSVQPARSDERAAVVLRASSRSEINTLVLGAVRGEMADGLKNGIFGKREGVVVVDAGDRRTLRDVGYETRVFTGRLSRTDFALEMPADFYPAEYATLDLDLHAATSPGLAQRAQLLVRVNDQVVKSYPLRNGQGEQFDGKRIELPLRAFRPGINRMEILAELPIAADAACRPEERDDAKPRFILLDKTALTVPALARIGRLPDLAAFAGKAYPYADGKAFDLYIDRADSQSAGAAFTVLSRLALAARAPLNATLAFGAPAQATGRNALVIASQHDFAELGAARKSAFPADTDMTATVADLMRPDPIVTASVPTAAGDDSTALLEAFRNSTTPGEGDLSVSMRARHWFAAASRSFGRWLNYQSDADSFAPPPHGTLVSLSQMRSPDGLSTWTVLQASAPRDIETGVQRLVEPAVWGDLEGGSAVIETAGLSLVSAPAASRYIAGITDRSPGNFRRLAAAWFSDNFQIYVIMVLGLFGLFALWLGLVVPKKGVRSDR